MDVPTGVFFFAMIYGFYCYEETPWPWQLLKNYLIEGACLRFLKFSPLPSLQAEWMHVGRCVIGGIADSSTSCRQQEVGWDSGHCPAHTFLLLTLNTPVRQQVSPFISNRGRNSLREVFINTSNWDYWQIAIRIWTQEHGGLKPVSACMHACMCVCMLACHNAACGHPRNANAVVISPHLSFG